MTLLDVFMENERLRNEWAADLNTEDPSSLQRSSCKKVWWRCDKGHSWQTIVVQRTQSGSGCPYCSGRRAIPGETDLVTLRPDLARQWDHEKNAGLDPCSITVGSGKKVWWRCEKGHSWQTLVNARVQNGSGCPYCSGNKAIPGETDIVTLRPDIACQWDYEKNTDIDPQTISASSREKVWWRCEKGHSWETMVLSRTQSGSGCPYCSGNKAIPGETDLATLRPEIARQWDHEKNGELVPENVTVGSRRKVWWRCDRGHSWQVAVNTRTQSGSGCPYCSGNKAIPGETDLATLYPELARQWDYEKNTELAPGEISAGSGKKVWWRCEQGHSWQAAVYARAKAGTGCPRCHRMKKNT